MSAHSHAHGEAQVWRLAAEADGSTFYYLKCHRQTGKWHSETHAYENWTAVLGDHAPRLRAARDEEPRALLLTALPGLPMEQVTLTDWEERAAWEAAGRSLARLHADLPSGPWFGACFRDGGPQEATPGRDAVAFVRGKINLCIKRGAAAGHLNDDEAAFARRAASERTAAFAGENPVAAHRDYSPRNWIMTPDDGIWRGAIDFEHSRWDVRASDFSRWWDRDFLERPDLAEAFFAGYGGWPDARLMAQIFVTRLFNAVCGIVWAENHADAPFSALNRAALHRLQTEWNRSAG